MERVVESKDPVCYAARRSAKSIGATLLHDVGGYLSCFIEYPSEEPVSLALCGSYMPTACPSEIPRPESRFYRRSYMTHQALEDAAKGDSK